MRIFCDNSFYESPFERPEIDDICWHAGRWHRYTVAGAWADHNQPETPAEMLSDFDLSPLQKFMGRRINWGQRTRDSRGWNIFRDRLRNGGIVGMDYSFDWVPPAPSPEKSPQERALDDFIAKRKAKRDAPPNCTVPGSVVFDNSTSTERALDRAMRRLSFHEQDIHTRLMPYRREEG